MFDGLFHHKSNILFRTSSLHVCKDFSTSYISSIGVYSRTHGAGIVPQIVNNNGRVGGDIIVRIDSQVVQSMANIIVSRRT